MFKGKLKMKVYWDNCFCSGLVVGRLQKKSVCCIMAIDRTVPHHAPSPHGLLRIALMRLSVHVRNNVHLRILQTTICLLHHECWLHCAASRTEPTQIIENHINAIVDACKWTVCSCVHYRWKFVRYIMVVDRTVQHHVPSPTNYWEPH